MRLKPIQIIYELKQILSCGNNRWDANAMLKRKQRQKYQELQGVFSKCKEAIQLTLYPSLDTEQLKNVTLGEIQNDLHRNINL